MRQQDAGRRAGSHQPRPLTENVIDQVVGDLLLRHGLAAERARLGALQMAARIGDVHESVQAGRHRPGAQQRLIDVHHLGPTHGSHSVLSETGGELAGASGGDREHRRVHLDPRGDAEHGHSLPDRLQDVNRGPVSAREQEQVDLAIGHRLRGRARVLRRCGGPGRPQHGRGQSGLAGLLLPHLARICQ